MEMHFLSDDATPRIDTNLEKECGFFQRNFESKFGTAGVDRVSLEWGVKLLMVECMSHAKRMHRMRGQEFPLVAEVCLTLHPGG